MEVAELKQGQRGNLAVRRMESVSGMRRVVADSVQTLAVWADDDFSDEVVALLERASQDLSKLRETMEYEIQEAAYGTEFAEELREKRDADG